LRLRFATADRSLLRPTSVSPARDFLETLDQSLALQVDPEHPIQLIDLMLVADNAQTLGFRGLRIAVDVAILRVLVIGEG
jgi:hypothetical protein